MKRQEDLIHMAQGIVADRTEATRRLVRSASLVIIAFLVAISSILGLALWRIGQITRHSECNVLEHRIVSRESFRTIIWALKDIATGAADPGERGLRQAAERVVVPPKIEPHVIQAYADTCEGVAGHDPMEGIYGSER